MLVKKLLEKPNEKTLVKEEDKLNLAFGMLNEEFLNLKYKDDSSLKIPHSAFLYDVSQSQTSTPKPR